MNDTGPLLKSDLTLQIDNLAGMIAEVQMPSGEIPWHNGGKTDPWDHVESAMGLNIGGRHQAARRAYEWIAQNQNPDGSWFAAYQGGRITDRTRDANLSSYIAVGIWHDYLITADRRFLARMWPTVRQATDFALTLQAPTGEVYWAISPEGRLDRMALLTGSSSISMSLSCALSIARQLGQQQAGWEQAQTRLKHAIRCKPQHFNMTKSRYAMDWYYPVLCGAYTGQAAQHRIDRYWRKYVIKGQGVRCVYDQPWVTIAETAELVLALTALGNYPLAEIVFGWMAGKQFDDQTFWCGYTYPDMVVWPEEKVSWTNAVVLMAADALYGLSPGHTLFYHSAPPVDRQHCGTRRVL